MHAGNALSENVRLLASDETQSPAPPLLAGYDPSLHPYLLASSEEDAEKLLLDLIANQIKVIIERAISKWREKDPETREDIRQEAIYKAVAALKEHRVQVQTDPDLTTRALQPIGKVDGYFYLVARNCLTDHIRKQHPGWKADRDHLEERLIALLHHDPAFTENNGVWGLSQWAATKWKHGREAENKQRQEFLQGDYEAFLQAQRSELRERDISEIVGENAIYLPRLVYLIFAYIHSPLSPMELQEHVAALLGFTSHNDSALIISWDDLMDEQGAIEPGYASVEIRELLKHYGSFICDSGKLGRWEQAAVTLAMKSRAMLVRSLGIEIPRIAMLLGYWPEQERFRYFREKVLQNLPLEDIQIAIEMAIKPDAAKPDRQQEVSNCREKAQRKFRGYLQKQVPDLAKEFERIARRH